MKKLTVILVVLALASFTLVGDVVADENSPHICLYTGLVAYPGEIISINVTDASGNSVYSYTLDNSTGTTIVFTDEYFEYLPAVSGTIWISYSGPYSIGSYSVPANIAGNGECFGDGRVNSRPDRDLAAPVAIYVRTEDDDGYSVVDIYDINQVSGVGTLTITVTESELNEAYDEVRAEGHNVTVAQVGDIMLTVLTSSTADQAICQVNAVEEREGKPYVYSWICLR